MFQTKLGPLFLGVLFSKVIFAVALWSGVNTAAAHLVTKVQPETRIRSSMCSTPSCLFSAHLNQLTTLSCMYFSNNFFWTASSRQPPWGRDKSAPRPWQEYATLPDFKLSEAVQDDHYSLFGWCSLDIVGVFNPGYKSGAVIYFIESITTNTTVAEV